MANKNYRKYAVTTLAAAAAVASVAPVVSSAEEVTNFPDVKSSSETETGGVGVHYDAIMSLAKKGIVSGDSNDNGKFHPWAKVYRGQIAKMITEAKDLDIPDDVDAQLEKYTDVNPQNDYADYIAAVTKAEIMGVFEEKTGTFGEYDYITREQMASVVVRAFDLDEVEGADDDVAIDDRISATHKDAVQTIANLNITTERSDFKAYDNISRAAFASFLDRTLDVVEDNEKPEEPEEPAVEGIESVSAINDSQIEVNFGKAVNEDLIKEAEKSGEYFRLFKEGDSAKSNDAIKSSSVSFSKDGKTATFTLEDDDDGNAKEIESGKKYSVALMDGKTTASDIVYEYGPKTLKSAASTPDFNVSSVSDKIVVSFSEKMKSTAKEVGNYEVYDEGGKKIANLNEVAEDEDGEWVDATKKKEVEFKLQSDNKLKAGKTYKVEVDDSVKTDDGNKSLDESERTVKVKTPSVKEAQPKAVTARVADKSTMYVTFDQNISADNVNPAQLDVQTTTGKTFEIANAVRGDNKNELKINLAHSEFEDDITYEVSLQGNSVTNRIFTNAANAEVSNLKAKAQADEEITSVKAALKADPKDKRKADLHLEFDQRPDIDSIETGDSVQLDDENLSSKVNIKYTGEKTIVIKDVETAFNDFTPKKGKSYDFEIKADGIKTDKFGDEEEGLANQSKLKTTVNGISVSEPEVDKVTLVSGDEIKVDFKEDISSLSSDDVTVDGYEIQNRGDFDENVGITADDLTTSVSGSTLTLKAKGDYVFETSEDDTNIKIDAESFTSKDSKVANSGSITIDDDIKDFVDNAAPVLLGADATNDSKEIKYTFTENVSYKGETANLFSVSNAAHNSVGDEISTEDSNVLTVTFEKTVFDTDTVLSRVESKYAGNSTNYLKDSNGNKVVNTTIKGVQDNNPAE